MGAPLKGFRSRSVGNQPYYRHWFQCLEVCVRARICVTLSPLPVFFFGFACFVCVWVFLALLRVFWPLGGAGFFLAPFGFSGPLFRFFWTLQVSFWPVNEKGDAPKDSVTNPKSFKRSLKQFGKFSKISKILGGAVAKF